MVGILAACTSYPADAAATFTTLVSFNVANGRYPVDQLVIAPSGAILGTTPSGGSTNGGTLFQVSAAGALTTLKSFNSNTFNADGSGPLGRLAAGQNGAFFGRTIHGGAGSGDGTIFRVNSDGSFATIMAMPALGASELVGGIVPDASGGFLIPVRSITDSLGSSGAIYRISATGSASIIARFPRGVFAASPLQADGHGGFAIVGGVDASTSSGVSSGVYRLSPENTLSKAADLTSTTGFAPIGTLSTDRFGNIYGTTTQGGLFSKGTVYRLTPSNSLEALTSFIDDSTRSPNGVIADDAGNLFGSTFSGGEFGFGSVFKVDRTGIITTLKSFSVEIEDDGLLPGSGLIADSEGNLYGTTQLGGRFGRSPLPIPYQGYGSIYKLSDVGFVTAIPEPIALVPMLIAASVIFRRYRGPLS
jgi:uncharacterized repeat protein (TIGR03803 family)